MDHSNEILMEDIIDAFDERESFDAAYEEYFPRTYSARNVALEMDQTGEMV